VGAANKTIAVSGATAGANTTLSNYNVSLVNNAASTINAAPLTLAASAQTKTYDGLTTVSNTSAYTATGLIAGENVTANLAYTDSSVGVGNKTVAISGAAQGANTSLSNYNVTYVNNAASTINAATTTSSNTNTTNTTGANVTTTNTSSNASLNITTTPASFATGYLLSPAATQVNGPSNTPKTENAKSANEPTARVFTSEGLISAAPRLVAIKGSGIALPANTPTFRDDEDVKNDAN
jgi:hypothetical protein